MVWLRREDHEDRELHSLSPWATQSRSSGGRRLAESDDPLRTVFQRDRDRIVHSTAFRRLQHKTQVVAAFEGDHYRSRMTHSLEVAQMSRGVARALRCNDELSEAIALAHDLGHPPFGHVGEEALHEKMAAHGRYGEPCPDCGAPIQRIRYADNETNYCAPCQTGGKLLADRALSRLLKKDWPRSLEEMEQRRSGGAPS